MIDNADMNRLNIRNASRASSFLQVFAIGLLIGLIYVFTGIYEKYQSLQDGIRENALWSVFQLDREARRLDFELDMMIAQRQISQSAKKKLSMRYDILFSRIDMMDSTNFDFRFRDDSDLELRLTAIRSAIMKITPWFDNLRLETPWDNAAVSSIEQTLDDITSETEELLTYTNSKVSSDRADMRDAVASLQIKSGVLIALLVACVGVLIFSLRRQLRSVRAAGLAFETIAAELNQSCANAEAGNRAKSQFMATMGHEVRTPLNAILGTAELLALSELPERVACGLQTIRRSGQSLLEILNEILDYAKIEHGQIEIETRAVDVGALAETAIEMMADRANARGDTLTLEIPKTLKNPVVMSDPTRLRQILLNLLSNAIKFTSNGQVTLRISESGDEARSSLRFEVLDTGIGIDEDGKLKLFRPFSQVDSSISRRYGGTGLGLTICKQIVETLGGSIGVDSTHGQGSVFWFEIPQIAATHTKNPPEQVQTAGEARRDTPPLPNLRILLVEDNVVNQQVAAGFLKHLGQTVSIASDGLEAVAAFEANSFDLVLMDMQMPNMDGIEATRQIRAREGYLSQVPIVAMTANASDDDRRRCVEAGMSSFQSKPVSLDQLRQIIETTPSIEAYQPQVTQKAAPGFAQRRLEIIDAIGSEAFNELLDAFFKDASSILIELRNALSSAEPAALDRSLHALKGAASSIGFDDVAAMAQRLRGGLPTGDDIAALKTTIAEKRQLKAA